MAKQRGGLGEVILPASASVPISPLRARYLLNYMFSSCAQESTTYYVKAVSISKSLVGSARQLG